VGSPVILALHRIRRSEEGQTLVLAAIFFLRYSIDQDSFRSREHMNSQAFTNRRQRLGADVHPAPRRAHPFHSGNDRAILAIELELDHHLLAKPHRGLDLLLVF